MSRTGRRAILVGLSSLAAPTAGCLSTDGSSSPDAGSPDSTATGTPVARRAPGESARVDGRTVTVADPSVRKMVVRDSEIWGDVVAGDGQFLLVDVTGADGPLVDDYETVHGLPLAVSLDGSPVSSDVQMVAEVAPDRAPTDPEGIEDHAAGLPVPTGQADEAAVVWTGEDREVRWELDAATRSRLARAPAFEVRSLETSVVDGGRIELGVTVENAGDSDGRWLGQVSWQGFDDASNVFGVSIPAGETVTRTVRPEILGHGSGGFPPGETVTVQFRSTSRVEREVTIPDETPTES